MKGLLLVVTLALSLPCGAKTDTSLNGVYDLVDRQVPLHKNSFSFELVSGDVEQFTISNSNNKGIHISCTTVSACNRGLYTYLTQVCGVDIWWTGSRLNLLPIILPTLSASITRSSLVQYRYYFNTVTFSYTTAFWSFDKWSLLLDWLALRGVNLPLAWNGNEYILIQVFREVGLSETDIASFLSGPAFQAWNRFGNIQGSWGGALPAQWINDQFKLSQQIVERMTDLGMTPVLPSFAGFVPKGLSKIYPNASIVTGSSWSGFPAQLTNDAFLEPLDPLFTAMQKSFISKQQKYYNNATHIYTLDQYNENNPFSGDVAYLRNVTANTFQSMQAADPDAIWLMQGWLFFSSSSFWTSDRVQAYLGGITDNSKMIILDLYSEAAPQWNRTSSYFGKPWIWCQLHDYGGNMGFEGNLDVLTTDPLAALKASSSLKGVGLTMEGQEGNEILYNILLDQAWSPTSINVHSYVASWVKRRYPVPCLPSSALTAWDTLRTGVYSNVDPNSLATVKSILELAPSLSGLVNRTGHHPTLIYYNTNTTIVPALKSLIHAGQQNLELLLVPEFAYDLVDIGRQLLANRFLTSYQNLVTVFNRTNSSATEVAAAGAPLLAILSDLDELLFTNDNFLVSSWISKAKALAGRNSTYAAYLEYNARNQITLWGPTGQINDYASKQWAGLVGGYYLNRWTTFVNYLEGCKTNGTAYNATTVSASLLQLGEVWSSGSWGSNPRYETWSTKGNFWLVVNKVAKKWA